MSIDTPTVGRNAIERGWIVDVAALAILLGLIAFLVPEASLLTVAIVFGIFLIGSGTFRLVSAFTSSRLPGWVRWLTGLLGVLILAAGIICLSNPWDSLTVLGIVIGVGWVLGGAASIASRAGRSDSFRWLPVTSGIASIVAGILVMIMPVLALASFIIVAAILLIVVGVATLLLLSVGPRTAESPAQEASSDSPITVTDGPQDAATEPAGRRKEVASPENTAPESPQF